jgi:hypothetical protein
VAVTVQAPAVRGAVYKPVVEPMEPQDAAQVALTLDVNCCVELSLRVALAGLIFSAGAAAMVSTTLAV